jgi:hypothetical protein
MGRILFYISFASILAVGAWYYYRGEQAPDAVMPLLVLLFALTSLGYGMKAQEDGDIGAGRGKIRRDRRPRAFRIALNATYTLAGALLLAAVYLFVA